MTLRAVPTTLREVCAVGTEHHRHHRLVAREPQDGFTAEIARLATDGTRNTCSKLYGATLRALLAHVATWPDP